MQPKRPIGIFDSGVGGLSVAMEITRLLPAEDLLYIGDQANVPYGSKPLERIQQLSNSITRFLLEKKAKCVVVACNTASAASLHTLRQRYPTIPFIGMEPAIKPASQVTQTGAIGVLATPATFKGQLYNQTLQRYANGKKVYQSTCDGLVEQIEAGELNSPKTLQILQNALQPMLAAGVDSVVLGCTHYPFVLEQIANIAGPSVQIINPAPAVARQVRAVLQERSALEQGGSIGEITVLTTGNVHHTKKFIESSGLLLSPNIKPIFWQSENLAS